MWDDARCFVRAGEELRHQDMIGSESQDTKKPKKKKQHLATNQSGYQLFEVQFCPGKYIQSVHQSLVS